MTDYDNAMANPCNDTVCEQFPDLTRMNYCHGQQLGAQDFVDEQSYYLNKMALLTRCLDGYGVACGLDVSLDPLPPKDGEPGPVYCLKVGCGVAVDPRGRELVRRHEDPVPLLDYLNHMPDRNDYDNYCKKGDPFPIYVTIRYRATPTRPQRKPHSGCCGTSPGEFSSRWQEDPLIELTCKPPTPQSCDSCCSPIRDPRDQQQIETRIWLAVIWFVPGAPPQLAPASEKIPWPVDNTIRRHITTYQTTTIEGVNWFHGAEYPEEVAKDLLYESGLKMTFSAPIDRSSIRDGVADVWRLNESGRRGGIEVMPIDVTCISDDRQLLIKLRKPKAADPLDRFLIKLRCDFVLDKCCQAVDGNHVGGRIPFVGWDYSGVTADGHKKCEEFVNAQKGKVPHVPSCDGWLRLHKRNTGNGTPGGEFESWIYVNAGDDELSY